MTENDDQLIKSFLLAGKREIADNGFSRRVIRRLPERAKWLSDILSVTCAILCCLLFYVFNGFGIIYGAICEIIASQSFHLTEDINFQSLIIGAVVLAVIGMQRILSLKW